MNELTRKVVTETALVNKAAARKNDISFDFLVRSAHWDTLIDLHGVDLKMRSLEIWQWWHPEQFCQMPAGDYVLDDGDPRGFDVDVELSRIVMRVLRRKIAREPDLQLLDWGDLPKVTVDPQLSLW